MNNARDKIRQAALEIFPSVGWEGLTVASICRQAGVSNGSFFHAFASKDVLGADLYLTALRSYHDAMADVLASGPTAEQGIERLVHRHLEWVTCETPLARLLFDQERAEWFSQMRPAQDKENQRFAQAFDRWKTQLGPQSPLSGIATIIVVAQIIGPAQITQYMLDG